MKVYELLYLFDKQLASLTNKQLASLNNPNIRFIKIAYDNVSKIIKEKYDINNVIKKSDIESLNITDNMKKKLTDLTTTKISAVDIKIIKTEKLIHELTNIAGIGKQKANELIKLGLKNINQLKGNKWSSHINDGSKLLLERAPLKDIPNDLIKKIENKFTAFKSAEVILVGGFIRKKPFSKDIDVMLVSDNLDQYISFLENQFDYVKVYSKGSDKASLIISVDNKYLKVDIFKCSAKYKHAMLLYAIGSKQFNIKMRALAKKQGFLLNQTGLYKLPIKNNTEPLPVSSERDFFKILNIPYVEPTDR